MTWTEYQDFLTATGLQQATLCRMLDIHPTTASRWKPAGEIPYGVASFIRAIEMLERPAQVILFDERGRLEKVTP